MSIPSRQCSCCHLTVGAVPGPYCARCGYPIEPVLEEQYLQTSMVHLQRELHFNSAGTQLRVFDLLRLQQSRFAHLQGDRDAASAARTQMHAQASTPDTTQGQERSEDTPLRPARPAISLASFFADQSINIVASLGAFLILIGSLSFIIATSDLFLSFLVLLIVHAVFGGIGSVTFKVPRLRVISVIYTAIFALQVPLVAFSALRWLSNNTQLPSESVLIMMAALYAMVTYGALAMYQRFKPFAYLAALSLLIALSSLPGVLHLAYWWDGTVLLCGALLLATCLRPQGLFASQGEASWSWEIMRGPALVLMYVCVALSALALFYDVVLALLGVLQGMDRTGVRFAIVVLLALLIAWVCTRALLASKYGLFKALPLLTLGLICAVVYLAALPFTAYILALTFFVALLVMLYWRYRDGFLRHVPGLSEQMLVLTFIIATGIPLLIDPWVLLQIAARVYHFPINFWVGGVGPMLVYGLLPVDLGALILVGCLLAWLLLVRRVTQDTTPVQNSWRWLLLFPAGIFSYVYCLALVVSGFPPVVWLFVLTIIWACLTVLLYRFLGRPWLAPGMLWTLVMFLMALFFALTPLQYSGSIIATSLLFLAIMATNSVWGLLTSRAHFTAPSTLVKTIAIIGQCFVLLLASFHGGFFLIYPRVLSSDIHLYAFVMATLGVILLGCSWPDHARQSRSQANWFSLYVAMFVLSWIPTIELSGLGITDMSVLYLCPGLCLLLLSVFVGRNEQIDNAHVWSQWCAILSACFLLGPALVFSFQQQSVQSSLILGGEALALLLLALLLRTRVLLMCGVIVVIVTAIHSLFLPSLGIPSFLALSLTGLLLLGIATLMLIVRPRLTVLWTSLE